ncbi:MAG: hypothetical protein ABW221_21240 [Vicinamibacteria bacterium]
MASGEELIQTVVEMEERARTVPPSVARAQQLAEAYLGEVEGYVERLAGRRERVDALQAQVDGVLRAFQEVAERERPILEGGMKQVENEVEAAREAIDTALDGLGRALDAAAQAAAALRGGLAEAGERTASARSEAGGALTQLRGQLTASESDLGTFVDAAVNVTDGVESEAEEAQQEVTAGLKQLQSTLVEYSGQHVPERVDRASAAFEKLVEEHAGDLATAVEALDDGGEQTAVEVKAVFAEQIAEPVGRYARALAKSVGSVEKAYGGVEQSSDGFYQAASEESVGLYEKSETMENEGVAAVKQGADLVGISWPS